MNCRTPFRLLPRPRPQGAEKNRRVQKKTGGGLNPPLACKPQPEPPGATAYDSVAALLAAIVTAAEGNGPGGDAALRRVRLTELAVGAVEAAAALVDPARCDDGEWRVAQLIRFAWTPAPRAPLARLATLRADPTETPIAGDADPAEPSPIADVADAIADEYPHIAIDTLAYQYTRPAPSVTLPRRRGATDVEARSESAAPKEVCCGRHAVDHG